MIRTKHTNVLEIIEKRLIPDEKAKQLRGEVFTPLNLVSEMLFGLRLSALKEFEDNMPSIDSPLYYKLIWGIDEDGNIIADDDDEHDRVGGIPLDVFRDPTTKWLDPANGIGNFPVVAFYMIDYQLNKHSKDKSFKGEKNTDKRRKHIIENMLYMIELNKGNTNTARKIFDLIVPGVKSNIFCANTLEITRDGIIKMLGTDEFDVVIGNPPYNSGGVKSSGTDSHASIWGDFIFQTKQKFPGAIQLLKKGGYLCFIHPYSWLQKNDPKNHRMMAYSIQFIRIYTDKQNNKLFSGGGNVGTTYYVLQNLLKTPHDKIIILDTENRLFTLSRRIYHETRFTIYRAMNNILMNIYNRFKPIGEVKDSNGNKYLKAEGKFNSDKPNGIYKNISTHTEDGITICKTSEKFKYLGQPKIILAGSRHIYHYDDYDGEYGVFGNVPMYIFDTIENLKKISKFLDTNILKIILEATKHSHSLIDFKFIPDIRDYHGTISDEALCKEFGIDYEYVRSRTFPQNNQSIAEEHNGCLKSSTITANKKTKKEKPKKSNIRKSAKAKKK